MMFATFCTDRNLDETSRSIYAAFEVEDDRLFIFYEHDNVVKKLVTYNVVFDENQRVDTRSVRETIRINRKKESNTLYTINALNFVIDSLGGQRDKEFQIDWTSYKDMLLLFDKALEEIVTTKIRLYRILKREDFDRDKTAIIKKNPMYY